jgi:chaperonin GroES
MELQENLPSDMLEDVQEAPPAPRPPEEVNLAEALSETKEGQDELAKIARQCVEEFENDLDSRAEWTEMHAQYLDIYYQRDVPQTPPWDNSSEESIPLLAEAVGQFQSRSYKAFFPNRYFIDCIPVGKSSEGAMDRAERIARHMSFQLGVLDRTYKPNKNQMFMAAALHGSDFTKTYWSPMRRQVIIERVRAEDLVVPYGVGPRRLEDIERKTQIKWCSINETKILRKAGWYIDEGTVYTGAESTDIMQIASDDAEGIKKQNYYQNGEGQCCILEQHTLLDLDDDGIAEPYIVWIDRQSRKILRIQIRYKVDEVGLPLDNKEPIEYYTHYQFLPNPNGFYGLGFGFLLAKINLAVNKLSRMFIDANELSVIGNLTYLISEQLGLPGDSFELSIGRGIKIPRSVQDINSHFKQLKFEPPSQQTMQMIDKLRDAAARLSSSTDILSGQPDKVYQPEAMLAMIEQGLQLFSSVHEFLGVSMEDELQKVFRLNAKYLQEDANFVFGDDQIQVTREDYQDDFRVVPVFDPKYSTRSQKLAKAKAEYDFVVTNPLMSQDQEAIYLSSKGYLEALDTENLDAKLKKPSPPPQPARIDDQNLENAYFLMPPDHRPLFDVFPDQDHPRHIKTIDQFIAYIDSASPLDVPNLPGGDPGVSRMISILNDEQKKELVANLLRHRSLHLAYMYGQLNGVMDQNGQPITTSNTGEGSAGGMATPAGNDPDLAQIMSGLQSLFGANGMQARGFGALPSAGGDDGSA